jgi:hypothetical protein
MLDAYFEKIKIAIILDGELRLQPVLFGYGFVEIRLAGEISCECLIFNVINQNVISPDIGFSHFYAELTFKRILEFCIMITFFFQPISAKRAESERRLFSAPKGCSFDLNFCTRRVKI